SPYYGGINTYDPQSSAFGFDGNFPFHVVPILKARIFYYLHYDPRHQLLFGLRDVYTPAYIIEDYNTTTLDVIQEYTQQNVTQYGWACDGCSVFDPNENWVVEVRVVSDGREYHAYYLKMDLNLVGKKKDITKLVLLTLKRGSILTETVMLYMNPYSKFQNKTSLLKTPFGWFVQSVQALFDESTRQILFLMKQTDLQQIQIIV
ncbi:unnamed protein product, partial [Rotaria sordida]